MTRQTPARPRAAGLVLAVTLAAAAAAGCEYEATDAAGAGSGLTANQAAGKRMAAKRGWTGRQWRCLNLLWTKESHWDHTVWNYEGSGAYGIPQALPARKMRSAGADWRTNPKTQIRWGLGYIEDRYGTPCSAWRFHRANNWY